MTDEQYQTSINNSINNILLRLEEIKTKELSVIERFFNYNEFNKMFCNTISEEEYELLINNLKIDKDKLINKLNEIQEFIDVCKLNIENNWKYYNKNYKNHLSIRLNSIYEKMRNSNAYMLGTDKPNVLLDEYYKYYVVLIEIDLSSDIMESFSLSDKNYVIFGKNGAGKTRLLNHIKKIYFNSNSYIIPSDREIKLGTLNEIRMDYKQKYNLTNMFSNKYVYPNDVLTLLIKDREFSDLKNNDTPFLINDNIRVGQTYNKMIKIFNSLGLERKIYLDNESNYFMLYNEDLNIKPYSIKNGSDGEKSIILFISYILLCPQNSFVFIDEPESHFNTALLNELFNMLESERSDIVFIYCTHNVDFIESRNNAQLVYLERFDGNNWNIKQINSFDDISMSTLVNVVGTKKKILFIESEKDKLDYKIYSSLFKEYKVIPVSSCDKVINNCKLLNDDNYLNFNRSAFGIIDNDFRTDEEIEKYLQKNIFTLPYNEIENLLLSSCILEYFCEKYSLKEKIDNVKTAVIDKAKKDKNGIIQDYLNKTYNRIQKKGHFKFDGDINRLSEEIDSLNENNKSSFVEKLNVFVETLDKHLNDRNYDELIKKYPNKGFVSCINQLEIKENRYIEWVIELINKDDEFRKKINKEIFNDFFK